MKGGILCGYDHSFIDGRVPLPFPLINVTNSSGPLPGLGNLLSDDAAVGRLAADYLIKEGYRHFLAVCMTALRNPSISVFCL